MSDFFSGDGDPQDAILSADDFARSLQAEFGPTLTEGPAEADTPDQPRDPQTGQFVAPEGTELTDSVEPVQDGTTEEEAEATESDTPAQDTVEDSDDGDIVLELTPELEAYLAKYDGDLTQALRAAAEAQSVIGRQGNDLGDLRRQMERLQESIDQGQMQAPVQPQYVGPYENDIEENPQGLVMEALERGDGQTLQRAIRAWAAIGPEESFEAQVFYSQLAEFQRQAEAQQGQYTPQDTQTASLEDAMAGVKERHPDAAQFATQVAQIQESFPTLQEELQYGDPAQQARAFEQLLVIAKGRAATPDTQAATRRLVIKTQEEVRKARDDAEVISAGNQSAAQAEESNPVQDALDAVFPTPQDPVKYQQTPDGRTVRIVG